MALHSRIKRINEELKSIIAEVVQNEVKDPRLSGTLVTVTHVDTSKDLSQAHVYFSALGDNEQAEKALTALEHSKGFIRSQVASRITFRHVPNLIFRYDETGNHAARINETLRKIEKDNPAAFAEETAGEQDTETSED